MGEAKKKKLGRRALQNKKKRQKSLALILGLSAGFIALMVCIWIIADRITFSVKETDDYSVGLNDDGTIIGFNKDEVQLCDYSSIELEEENLMPSDSDVDSYIASMMEAQGLTADSFTDAFVMAYMSDMGSTVEEYRESYKKKQYDVNIEKAILTYLNEKSEVKSYPKGYLEGLMGLIKTIEPNSDFSRKEYYALLRVKAERNAKQASVLQALYETEGLTVSEANKDRVISAYGVDKKYYSTLTEKYGEGFLNQAAIEFAVLDFLKERIVIKEKEQ